MQRFDAINQDTRSGPRLHHAAIVLVLVALLLPLLPRTATATKPSPTPPTRAMLWRISDAEERDLWLLGSIHVADRSIYPLPASVDEAFGASSVLAVEADVSRVDQGAVQQQMMQSALDPSSRSLTDRLPAALHAETAARLRAHGMDIAMLEPMRPWFVALILTNLALRDAGLSPEHGIEHHFIGRAGDREVVELEGVARQLQVFSSFSDDVDVLFLRHALLDTQEVRVELTKILDAWRTGNVEAIALLRAKMREEHPELAPVDHVLFTERNREMTEKIAGYLETGKRHFVIVGAAHLVGEDGIVRMLERRGLRAERR